MIHVGRARVPKPAILDSPQVHEERKKLTKIFGNLKAEQVVEYPFVPKLYWNPEIKKALFELFHGKCAYCETLLTSGGELDHFRPKRGAVSRDGTKSPGHYYWLAYEWENLYLSCQMCNRLKATRFATTKSRAKPGRLGATLFTEDALLLDPCDTRQKFWPDHHLTYVEEKDAVVVVSDTVYGQYTIECLALNRAVLVQQRGKELAGLKALLSTFNLKKRLPGKNNTQMMNLLKSSLAPDHQYAGMNRQFVRRYLLEVQAVPWYRKELFGEESREESTPKTKRAVAASAATFKKHVKRQASYSVETETAQQKEIYYSGAKRIERIEFRNFKAIEKLDLVFPSPPTESPDSPATNRESWMMLLGENSTGKSSLLQGIALALMGERHCNELGLDARRFVRRKAARGTGSVKITLTNIPQPITLTVNNKSKRFKVTPKEPKVLLLGYGATRLLPPETHEKGTTEKHVRIKNLFMPTAPLNDAEAWLLDRTKLPDDRFVWVKDALKKLLMLPKGIDFQRVPKSNPKGLEVQLADGKVGLRDLSDGLQSVLALCTDIMISLLERWDVENAEGLVLLDEIEVHLHPRWKIEIVQLLRSIFPRVAFITTTHDPLCLKGLQCGEIVVLRRNERNRVIAITDVPPVDELRADQLLTSPLFGMHSTRGRTSRHVVRYSQLLGKRRRTTEEQEELQRLKLELDTVLSSGENSLEREAEAILHRGLLSARGGTESAPDPRLRTGMASTQTPDDKLVIPDAALREQVKLQLAMLLKK